MKDQWLNDIQSLNNMKVEIDSKILDRIVRARLAGATWQEIADTLGIFKQAACRKYSAAVKERLTELSKD